jgi:acyl-CoA hydrolase
MAIKRTVGESVVWKTEVVCPNDTNPMGILQGGRLVQWMDIAAAVCAQTHAGKICVTASIDKVQFRAPARVGDIVRIEARVTCTFTTSMEIYVSTWKQIIGKDEKQQLGESFFTFVALDEHGKPVGVPELQLTNEVEQQHYDKAKTRRAQQQ